MQNCSSVTIFFKYLSVQVNIKKNIHIVVSSCCYIQYKYVYKSYKILVICRSIIQVKTVMFCFHFMKDFFLYCVVDVLHSKCVLWYDKFIVCFECFSV